MVHKVLGRPLSSPNDPTWALTPNDATSGLAHAIATAHDEYLRQRAKRVSSSPYGVSVVMVVQAGEKNIGDQKMLEAALWSNHQVRLRRATLAEVATQGALDDDGALVLGGGLGDNSMVEVSVAYFRAG